jgi:hypothetical protein
LTINALTYQPNKFIILFVSLKFITEILDIFIYPKSDSDPFEFRHLESSDRTISETKTDSRPTNLRLCKFIVPLCSMVE